MCSTSAKRPLVAHLLSKRTRLVERGRRRGVVAADAERPSQRGQQAGLVRAHGVAECRQRPLADLHRLRPAEPSTPAGTPWPSPT